MRFKALNQCSQLTRLQRAVVAGVGKVNEMMEIIRFNLATTIAGWSIWVLGKMIIQGFQTGAIHHTDSSRVFRKQKNPLVFWSLVALFSAFIIAIGSSWFFEVADAIGKMK